MSIIDQATRDKYKHTSFLVPIWDGVGQEEPSPKQEILYFLFKIYKKIKAPAEWISHILFLKATTASQPHYLPDTLFNEVQSKYTNLTNQGLWHPSSKTLEEQTLAMVAQQQPQ